MKKIQKAFILFFLLMFSFTVVLNADETELGETSVQETVHEEIIEEKNEEKTPGEKLEEYVQETVHEEKLEEKNEEKLGEKNEEKIPEEKTPEETIGEEVTSTPSTEKTNDTVTNETEEPKEEVKEVPDVKASPKAVTHYLNIEFLKTIVNPDNSESSTSVNNISYGHINKKGIYTWEFLGLPSRSSKSYQITNCDGNGQDCLFTFDGWYTEDGTKITTSNDTIRGAVYNSSGADAYLISTYSNTAINVVVGTLPYDVNIKLYAKFKKTYIAPPEQPDLKILFYNTLTGNKITEKTFENDTITASVNMYQYIKLTNATSTYYEVSNSETGKITRYTFLGWYTESDTLIESENYVSGLPTGVKIKRKNDSEISSLYVQTDGLTKREEIKLYAKWNEETFDIPKLKVKYHYSEKNEEKELTYANNNGTQTVYTHQNIGLADSEATYYDETRTDGSIYRHTFLGWYTIDNTLIESENCVSGLPNGVCIKRKSDSEPSALYVTTENLSEVVNVDLYDKWNEELYYYPYKLTINYVDVKDNIETTVATRKYEKNTTKEVERTYSLLGMKSEADDYVDEKNDQNQLTGYRYFFTGWYTETGEQLTFSDFASLTAADIRLAYDEVNPSSLYIKVADLNQDETINLFARWEKEEVGMPNDTTLTIKYYDTRSNNSGDLVKTDTYKDASVKAPYQTYSYLGLSTPALDFINEGDYKYIFTGWYTETGDKIVYESYNTSIPGLKIKKYANNQSTALDIRVINLEEDKEINLYAKWKKVRSNVKVTVHLYDDKHDLHGVEIVYDSANDNDAENVGGTINSGSMPAVYKVINNSSGQIILDLNEIFTAIHQNALIGKNDYQTINRNTLEVHVNHSPVIYTFKNWLDSQGNVISSDDDYKIPVEDSKVAQSFKVIDTVSPSSAAEIKKQLIIAIKGIEDMDIDEDTTNIDINIYADWDEYTTAILDHQYIDKVSTGSGSWNNPEGGVVEYRHKYTDPSLKTPTPHYEFQYWKYEAPSSEDDQIDPNREYKNNDVFYYDLFYKPDKWVGSAIAYAYWKADVTLELYDGNKLLGSKTDMNSVSISDILSNNPSRVGYIFKGWLDESNNKVTEETFYGEGPSIKPEAKLIKLHVDWEQIMVEVIVTKKWSDNNNNDRIRPDSVKANLMSGDTIVDSIELSEENKWTYKFIVPMYIGENIAKYIISEEEVTGYTPEITGSMEDGFNINNVHENEQVKIVITKIWDDNNDEDEVRPTSVTINLMNGENIVDTVILNDDNNWTYTFIVDMKSNGTTIEYTVSEEEVEFYEPIITGNMEDGYEIKNYHEPWPKGDGDIDDEPEETIPSTPGKSSNNPKTGDSIIISIIMLIVSMLGLARTTLYVKKYNN